MKPTWPPLAELSSALQKKKDDFPPQTPMDSVDVCAATSTADNDKRRVHKRNRDWLTRLHLRKAALQPAAMQTPDKPGPKKIATAAADKRTSTAWPPSKSLRGPSKTPRGQETEQRALGNGGNAGNALRFKCSQCADNVERAPKDLVKHFDEKHKGCPPVFSCQACKFTTHEFSYLQVHVLSHKDTFSCCSLCRDDVQRTWAEFSAHLAKVHARNGKYPCDVCKKFSTSDDKEFLEHVLLHNLGLDMANDQAICKTSHRCQCCDYETSQKVVLAKHTETAHEGVNCNRKSMDLFPTNETKAKGRTTRSAVKDISWLTQDCLSLPGREFLDKYCHLSDAQTTLEETQQFLMKSGKQKWSKALKDALSYVPQEVHQNGVVPVLPDSSQDVLTLNNKLNQNGASFAKRLKLMTEKEVGNSNADSRGKMASDASSNRRLQRRETKLSSDVVNAESTEGPQTEENRENQRLKSDLNERDGDEAAVQDGAITNELKAKKTTTRTRGKTTVRKAAPRKKQKKNWRNAKKMCKNVGKLKAALALRIVLKKNPKKGKQWVTQTAASPAKCNSTIDALKMCNNKSGARRGDGAVNGEREAGDRGTGKQTGEIQVPANEATEKSPEKSEVGEDARGSDELEAPGDVFTEASPLVQSVITPQSETPSGSSLASRSGPSPPPPAFAPWTATPKSLERTLHLVAVSPAQPVKRPAGEQPVVVLNHPDVDAPEVSRVMAVVNRYKGEVHKVVLSKRTLNALAAVDGDAASSQRDDEDGAALRNGVRERFLLKLKLRRLSKRKFEVVGGETTPLGAGEEETTTFRCWFCGRVFGSRRAWVVHKQRHLMEWKSPKCENS